ncbi:DUF7660 family protein [Alienimonas chondri]|uniref:DUF7660 domain-containing protein n=1 Tax=Alienimonas chondri TaxID=2681879 RepID=A0ABX1VBJ0_9PLAN|nr:hypothetical protein [Alienimonas chondri]NNJ25054.1 hypothetical protein [Alienimonas chondri]
MAVASSGSSSLPHPEGVRSRAEFAEFLQRLRGDLEVRPDEWENVTLESFLEAFAAIAHDAPGWVKNGVCSDVESPSWALFARLVSTAAHYE